MVNESKSLRLDKIFSIPFLNIEFAEAISTFVYLSPNWHSQHNSDKINITIIIVFILFWVKCFWVIILIC